MRDNKTPVGRILGTTGAMRPSEALERVMEMTPEESNTLLQCFAPEGAKLLQGLTMTKIAPIPEDFQGSDSDLSDWQAGTDKPAIEGPYLRDFDEGEALSTWADGKWLRDGFFPSDVQDAPWRGIKA